MRLIVNQMINCAAQNWFYPAIITACALPDICAAIDTNGETDKSKYIKWWNKYAAPYYDGAIAGDEAYHLRCAILHQGRVTHKHIKRYKGIGFIEGHSEYVQVGNGASDILFINVTVHCDRVGKAVLDWLNEVEKTKKFEANYEKFFKRAKSVEFFRIYNIPIIIAI